MTMEKMGAEAMTTAITTNGTLLPVAAGEPSGYLAAVGTSCSMGFSTTVKDHGAQAFSISYVAGASTCSIKSRSLGNLLSGSCDIMIQSPIVPASGQEPIYMQLRDAAGPANNLYTVTHTFGGKLTLKGATNWVSTVNFDPTTWKSIRLSWSIDTVTAANCKVRIAVFGLDSDTAIIDSGWITLAPLVLAGVQFIYSGLCGSLNANYTVALGDIRVDPAQNDLIPYLGSLVVTSTADKTTGDTPSSVVTITATPSLGNANAKTYYLMVEYSANGTFTDTVTTNTADQASNILTYTPASGTEGSYRLTAKVKQNAV